MGWANSIGPGIAPPDLARESVEMAQLRRKAAQAGQLTSLGAAPELAGRWAGRRRSPTPQDYIENFEEASAYGPLAERTEKGGPLGPGAYFAGYDESERAPLPIFGNTMEVPADRSELGARAEGIPGLENALSGSAGALPPDEEITVRPPAPKAPAFLGRFGEWIDEGGPERGVREGGDRLVDAYDAVREEPPVTTPWWLREALERAPDLQRRGDAAGMEQGAAPSGIGARPAQSAPSRDFSSMSQGEFQRGIGQAQAGMVSPQERARAQVSEDIAGLPSIEELQAKYGTREDLGQGLGREELPSGERRWTAPGVSISMSGTPDPEMEAQARAGLADRAFKPQTFDPAEMDVSQATLEHAMAQRAAKAQLSGLEAQARQQGAQADAAERDPLGIERYRAQQAIQDARYAAQNAGRRDVSLADDQFRAQQKSGRDAEVQKITTDYLDTRRALEEELARIPPNAPPDSLEAAKAAEIQRELDRNERQTELELAQRGVRINSGT